MAFPHNPSSLTVVQRVPRHTARADRAYLPLNDGGHGSAPAERNPLFYGLGAELVLDFNAFVRTFQVFIEGTNPNTGVTEREEITSQFSQDKDITTRWRAPGAVGYAPEFALTSMSQATFAAAQTLRYIVVMTNSTISTTTEYELVVQDDFPISVCPPIDSGLAWDTDRTTLSANDLSATNACDLQLMGALSKAGIRVFENLTCRDATENVNVSFFFNQLDLLVARVDNFQALLPNYSATGTVGVEFAMNDTTACGYVDSGSVGTACARIDCCCLLSHTLATVVVTNLNTAAVVTGGSSVGIGHNLEFVVTVPTFGNCSGFDNLQALIPGSDTTGGRYTLTSTPTATVGGAAAATTFTQASSGNSGTLDFTNTVNCGSEIVITFTMAATMLTGTNLAWTPGFVQFTNPGDLCYTAENVILPGFAVTAGGGGGAGVDATLTGGPIAEA